MPPDELLLCGEGMWGHAFIRERRHLLLGLPYVSAQFEANTRRTQGLTVAVHENPLIR